MGPIRRSRGVNKRYSYYNEESPIRHGESADRRSRQKRMLFDPLGPRWSKEEIELFYELYRKHGKDWRKVAVGMRNRSIEMVEALYSTNRAYLSLPEGTASVAGLIAMMTDHYANLDGSDNEKQSNDGPGTSQKPQKHGLGKAQAKFLKGSRGNLLSPSQEVASSYGHLQISKKKRSVGIRPHAVGKRTPRIPVSFSYENKNSEKLISPTKQSISKADSDDDELAEIAKTLTEVSHRGGFLQVSLTPRRVGSCDINEDGSNQGTEADNGDFPRTNNFRMRDGNVGTASQNGKRRYGNKAEAYNGKNQLDEIREACSGTGQMLDAEVTNAKFSRSSHDSRKRSKKVLFGRDKGSDLHPLEFLADCSLMPETENDNGRPFYIPKFDEIMASKNYSFSLRQLFGVHIPRPQKIGDESGSSAHKEDGAESVAREPVIIESGVEVGEENPSGSPVRKSKKQKRKSVTPTPGSGANAEDDAEDVAKKPSDERDRVGKYSLEEFGEMVDDIPREEDWKAMGDAGMREVLRGLIGDLGKAAMKAAGASALMKKKDDKLTNSIKLKDEQILELGKSLSEMKVAHQEEMSELKGDLISEQDRVTDLERRLSEAEKKLEAVKPEKEVIEEFQKTDEYNQAIANAGAPEILRAWKVAEKLIKTDPSANWDSFIDAFIAAKEAVERGKGEPELFDGPNPLIFQVNPENKAAE